MTDSDLMETLKDIIDVANAPHTKSTIIPNAVQDVVDALRLIEHSGQDEFGNKICPVCETYKEYGHTDNCNIKLALAPFANGRQAESQ